MYVFPTLYRGDRVTPQPPFILIDLLEERRVIVQI